MVAPVTAKRIKIAEDFGLRNVKAAAAACREAGLPFFAACALLEKESGGRNVYGHDKGGALSGFPGEVNEHNFAVFEWLVFTKDQTSNGVGPTQITWKGFFTAMEKENLRAWAVEDNLFFGFRLLAQHYKAGKTWRAAGRAYNGADAYGIDLEKKVAAWKKRLGI